jgi:TolB-like protein/tetratricopeptide (TPR) repeat protein
LSPDRDQQHFCEGVADEIVLVLTRLKGLRVASRTEAFLARATIRQAREIGERLGVEAILEGSVRTEGSRLRVSVALVDVATGSHLWTDRFDGEAGDIFAIQDTIARRVAEGLRGPLSPRDTQALRRGSPPQIQAYDFYLRGRQFFQRCSRRGLEFALGMFTRAIEIDPGYARAHAGLANSHAFLYLHAGRLDAHRQAAAESAARALELAPDSAEAHAAQGLALSLQGKAEEAERAFRTALSLNPGLFEACYFYARMCFMQGRQAEAIELFERATAIRPDDYQAPLLVAQVHDDQGQTGKATAARRLGTVRAEEHLKLHPDDTRALYMGANGFVALGEVEKGLSWARRALEIEPDESMVLYNVACIYSLAGQVGPALDCLERAVANGLNAVAWVKNDSNLDAVRSDPRYARLVSNLEAVST